MGPEMALDSGRSLQRMVHQSSNGLGEEGSSHGDITDFSATNCHMDQPQVGILDCGVI